MKNLLKILKYVIPYWGYTLLNIVFNILSIIFSLASITLFIPVLQILFKTTELPTANTEVVSFSIFTLKEYFYNQMGQIIANLGEMQVLFYICISVIVLYFLRNLFRYLALFYLAPIRNGVVRDLRNKMYRKVLILPLSYYSEQKKGDIIARMTSDVQEIEWSIMSSLEMMFRDPINIIFYLIVLLWMNAQLTLFVLILFPISGFIIGRIGKKP